MKAMLYLGGGIGHLVLVAAYWLLSGDAIGTTLLLIFGIAMAVMVWVLGPTLGDVGPTAPVDADWHERRR